MIDRLKNEKGGALILVLAALLVVSIMVIPLVALLNTGLMQAHTDAKYEQASETSESGVRILQKLLKLTADPSNTEADNRALVTSLTDQMESRNLLVSTEYKLVPSTGEPGRIEVTSSCQIGTAVRKKTTPLIILRFPKLTPGSGTGSEAGPTQNSSGDEFYYTRGAVVNYPAGYDKTFYNNVFKWCDTDPSKQAEVLVDNNYPADKYAREFTSYTGYYLGSYYDEKEAAKPSLVSVIQPSASAGWELLVGKAGAVSNSVTQSQTLYYNSGAGIQYPGPISIQGSNPTLNALSNGSSVEASGSFTTGEWLGTLTFNGHVKVGGNVTFNKFNNLRIKGDLLSRGNVVFNQGNWSDDVTIDGDLVATGDIKFYGVKKVTVKGNLIAGGTITFDNVQTALTIGGDLLAGSAITVPNSIDRTAVQGSMLAGGSIHFSGASSGLAVEGHLSAPIVQLNLSGSGLVSVGKWTAGGLPANGDIHHLAAHTLKLSSSTNPLRVTGSLSAASFPDTLNPKNVWIGGSLIAGSALTVFQMDPWTIKGDVSVGGLLTVTSTISSFYAGGSLFATGGINIQMAMGGSGSLFRVAGSIVLGGAFLTSNGGVSMYNFQIDGDVLVKGALNLAGTMNNMTVGGSIISDGDLSIGNSAYNIQVGRDMMTNGSMSFMDINNKLAIGGLFGAKNNIHFGNHTNSANASFGGFYAGGTTSFTYQWSIGTFCIRHDPPAPGGSGSGGGAVTIEFGN